jgi:hypothetical protein
MGRVWVVAARTDPFAACIAARSEAASSFGSRARNSTMPSSRSCQHTRRLVCCLIRKPSTDRKPLIIRANWEAVAVNANCASRCSSTTSTTRVNLPHLRIRQPGLPKQSGNSRHPPQSFRDPDVFPRHPRSHRTTPRQPMRQRFEPRPISDRPGGVELPQQLQQHIGRPAASVKRPRFCAAFIRAASRA